MGTFNTIGWLVVILTGITSLGGQAGEQSGASLHHEHQKEIAIWFAPDRTEVCLHARGAAGLATAHFELLDNSDQIMAQAEKTTRLSESDHLIASLPFAVAKLTLVQQARLKWYRLRYNITVNQHTQTRIVTVDEAMQNQFALQVTAPEGAEPGTTYKIVAHATTLNRGETIPGMPVHAILRSLPEKAATTATDEITLAEVENRTDEYGLAAFEFPLKANASGVAKLTLSAFKDGAFETQVIPIFIARDITITISTDKPIYQPGQTIHSRILTLGRVSHQALGDLEVKFALYNAQNDVIATAPEHTDRFGVAAHDFELTNEASIGSYRVELTETSSNARNIVPIEVSRYELPIFTVKAEPDKPFYLGNETAHIKLRADYLFGKPIAAGRATLVADEATSFRSRRRNKKVKSLAETTGKKLECDIVDGVGEIVIANLQAPTQSDYVQYFDTSYSAYITDTSTSRTEQSKVRLRVSREAIYAYIQNNETSIGNLAQFYLTADYADGTPAECDVELDLDRGSYKGIFHTNRYGIAKVSTDYIAPIPPTAKPATSRYISVHAGLRDKHGVIGSVQTMLTPMNDSRIRLSTDRSIYRAGEPVQVTVVTPQPEMLVRLEVIKEGLVIRAGNYRASNGVVRANLASSVSYEGLLTIGAYAADSQNTTQGPYAGAGEHYPWGRYGGWTWSESSQTIIFPPQSRLDLNVKVAQKTVKPGEESEVEFQVTDGSGHAVETSLGVAVIDKSVSALADTNQKFGAKYYANYYYGRWNALPEVSGVGLADLLNLDFAKPIPEDISLVAELILKRYQMGYHRSSSRDVTPDFRALYLPLYYLMRDRVAWAISKSYSNNHEFPSDEAKLSALFNNGTDAGGESNNLLDPWGRPYKLKLGTKKLRLAAWNGKELSNNTWAAKTKGITVRSIIATSAGLDGIFGTPDDIEQVVMDYPGGLLKGKSHGAVHGAVTSGSKPAASVRVTATPAGPGQSVETLSDKNGQFKFTSLTPGLYRLEFKLEESTRLALVDLIVLPGTQVLINPDLPESGPAPMIMSFDYAEPTGEYGGVMEVVALSGGPTDSGDALTRVSGGAFSESPANEFSRLSRNALELDLKLPAGTAAKSSNAGIGDSDAPQETPRLRQYFPETLVWRPQLITDTEGKASLKFTMADTITTWQLAVIGSTVDGKIGSGGSEIRAFQDFFADPQLPPNLTEGDKITLPVLTRNYTDNRQSVSVTLDQADWFSQTDPRRQELNIDSAAAGRVEFAIQALKPGDYMARVSAIGNGAADAVERPVRVGYDGQEINSIQGDLLESSGSYDIEISPDAIAGSASAALKLFPNALSSALQGVEGMTQQPHGCAEQTISSTYGNLIVLGYLKQYGHLDKSRDDWSKIEREARRNLEQGIQRLYAFQTSEGGFPYFGETGPDVALTAYAIRFLSDAAKFSEVDKIRVLRASNWLISAQEKDGSWRIHHRYWDTQPRYATTAYALQALAVSGRTGEALTKGLAYLDRGTRSMADPYAIALYALAAQSNDDQARLNTAVEKLTTLAKIDRNGAHWDPPGRTLFYGWGNGGTVEATALAIQALEAAKGNSPQINQLVGRGLLYLTRLRDRYGCWYSTQATVLALQVLIKPDESSAEATATVDLYINGGSAQTIRLNDASETGAVTINLTTQLKAGSNRIELRRAGGPRLGVQLLSRHYVRWDNSMAERGASDKLGISVSTDKHEARIGEFVKYTVPYNRLDWQESGMAIIEVGLPPGVEVERASLQALLSRTAVYKYSINPDRVVFYVWQQSAKGELQFNVRPRLAMTAKTARTIIYDFYNPDAWRVAAPLQLVVHN